ncbi:MAG TPA: hypothetical protein VG253_19290 [Streptosporangiaceae bacterium]|nr:hypothetical protein [Streptosporangiaceae bacterium]
MDLADGPVASGSARFMLVADEPGSLVGALFADGGFVREERAMTQNRPSLQARLVAVTLADQVGQALSAP